MLEDQAERPCPSAGFVRLWCQPRLCAERSPACRARGRKAARLSQTLSPRRRAGGVRTGLAKRKMHESFFDQVYGVVSRIPRGRVATYGQIAAFLGNPRAARTVGWALHSMPSGLDLPWHRVVNSQGRISGPANAQRAREQRWLLEEEGVTFDQGGSIDLSIHGWKTRT